MDPNELLLWNNYSLNPIEGSEEVALFTFYFPLAKNSAFIFRWVTVATSGVVDKDDLESLASLGILKAIRRFDVKRGFKFSTYARYWIRESILSDANVRPYLPKTYNREYIKVRRAIESLTQSLGRTPLELEIATHAGLPLDDVTHAMEIMDSMIYVSYDDSLPGHVIRINTLDCHSKFDRLKAMQELKNDDQRRAINCQDEGFSDLEIWCKLFISIEEQKKKENAKKKTDKEMREEQCDDIEKKIKEMRNAIMQNLKKEYDKNTQPFLQLSLDEQCILNYYWSNKCSFEQISNNTNFSREQAYEIFVDGLKKLGKAVLEKDQLNVLSLHFGTKNSAGLSDLEIWCQLKMTEIDIKKHKNQIRQLRHNGQKILIKKMVDEQALKVLTDQERAIVRLQFQRAITDENLADQLGINEDEVPVLRDSAHKKLFTYFFE